jgi:addiction module HigA family antidote
MPPTHPGVILRDEFLAPLGLTDAQLAEAIAVPLSQISAITQGKLVISTDTGLRLARYFGMSDAFFTGLQDHYERELAKDRASGARDPDPPR